MRGVKESREVRLSKSKLQFGAAAVERICSRFEKQLQLLRISFHWSNWLQLYKEPHKF